MKKNINELREMLLNKEMSFTMLDNIMHNSGYYSVFEIYDDGITKDIKNYLTAIYTAIDTNTAEIQLFFEITEDNAASETEENFRLRITDIQEF